MNNPIIVQSNTLCPLKKSCNADTDLVFLQLSQKQSDAPIKESVVLNSLETRIYPVWRDWCLDRNFPQRYI